MSRYNHPFMSQDRACFCCPPSSTPDSSSSCTINDNMMKNDDESIFLCDSNYNQTNATAAENCNNFTSPSNSANNNQHQPIDPNLLNDLFRNIHLLNQNELNTTKSSTPFSSPYQHNEEASPIDNIQSEEKLDVFDSTSSELKPNFRFLHSRQIGSKANNTWPLSTSAPSMRLLNQAEAMPDILSTPVGVSGSSHQINEQASNVVSSFTLPDPLDLALDELGMLSTITKSRHDFLKETKGNASALKRERRLRSKSESSPNLSSLVGRLNGLHIVHLDSNYVTSVTNDITSGPGLPSSSGVPLLASEFLTSTSPLTSQSIRMDYRNTKEIEISTFARRRRSVPRMSRLRSGRYLRSRCPYKVPNRLCNSMHEEDFDMGSLQSSHTLFSSSMTSLPDQSKDRPGTPSLTSSIQPFVDTTASPNRLYHNSKSNSNSPVKPWQDHPLVRSLSVEDLHSANSRKLNLFFDNTPDPSQKEADEARVAQMSSQFTDLHMS